MWAVGGEGTAWRPSTQELSQWPAVATACRGDGLKFTSVCRALGNGSFGSCDSKSEGWERSGNVSVESQSPTAGEAGRFQCPVRFTGGWASRTVGRTGICSDGRITVSY